MVREDAGFDSALFHHFSMPSSNSGISWRRATNVVPPPLLSEPEHSLGYNFGKLHSRLAASPNGTLSCTPASNGAATAFTKWVELIQTLLRFGDYFDLAGLLDQAKPLRDRQATLAGSADLQRQDLLLMSVISQTVQGECLTIVDTAAPETKKSAIAMLDLLHRRIRGPPSTALINAVLNLLKFILHSATGASAGTAANTLLALSSELSLVGCPLPDQLTSALLLALLPAGSQFREATLTRNPNELPAPRIIAADLQSAQALLTGITTFTASLHQPAAASAAIPAAAAPRPSRPSHGGTQRQHDASLYTAGATCTWCTRPNHAEPQCQRKARGLPRGAPPPRLAAAGAPAAAPTAAAPTTDAPAVAPPLLAGAALRAPTARVVSDR